MSTRPAPSLLPGITLVQVFKAEHDRLSRIAPRLATYRNVVCGEVTITVHEIQSQKWLFVKGLLNFKLFARLIFPLIPKVILGRELGRLVAKGEAIVDNDTVDVYVDNESIKKGELYAIKVSAKGATSDHASTIWLSDGVDRIKGHEICFINNHNQYDYGLMADTFYSSPISDTAVPTAILYSPVTQCNLNCIHCISRHTRKKLSKISGAVKEKMLDMSRKGTLSFISSDYSGDILWADHRFGGELDFLFSLNVPFHIDTNGVYLTQTIIDRLVKSRLHSINISLDAATDENYQRVRKGAPSLAEVWKNIAALVSASANSNARFSISVSFTLMNSTLHEWEDFLRAAASVGVFVVYARHLEVYTQDMRQESLWNDKQRYNEARLSALAVASKIGIELHTPEPFKDSPPRTGHRGCNEPWKSAVILGNGDVAACCVPGNTMGNLKEQSLEEIWNGPKYQKLRATINSSNPPWPCSACPIFRHTENSDSYLVVDAKMPTTRTLSLSVQSSSMKEGRETINQC